MRVLLLYSVTDRKVVKLLDFDNLKSEKNDRSVLWWSLGTSVLSFIEVGDLREKLVLAWVAAPGLLFETQEL